MSSCCLGHYPFSNMPKMDFWSNGNSIHDTMRLEQSPKIQMPGHCWYYYYWHNCVTTWCTSFTKAINAASECLPILAHTFFSTYPFSILSGNYYKKMWKKEKRQKSVSSEGKIKLLVVVTNILETKSSCKTKTTWVTCVFIFRFLGIWENSQECIKGMSA